MKVCKYFEMYGRCSRHSGATYVEGFISYIDMDCPYVSQLGNPTKRQEKCEDYEPLDNEKEL